MKKILLPTDYSEHAKRAIEFTFRLFDHLDAAAGGQSEFLLLHAYPLPTAMPIFGQLPPTALIPPIDEEEKRLNDNLSAWKQAYPNKLLRPVLVGGPLLNALSTTVQEEDIQLVVMGTKGAGGVEEVLLGSNAARAAKSLDVPVLIIPEQATYVPPQRIVFATDFQRLDDLSLLSPLLRVVRAFDANILTLHVMTEGETPSGEKERMNRRLRGHFGTLKYAHHFLPSDDPAEAIDSFLRQQEADWLVLVGKQRTFFESLFHRSVIRKMAFHTTIPLLVLH
jgi:nucleotide-binding universal stress UspA family protein